MSFLYPNFNDVVNSVRGAVLNATVSDNVKNVVRDDDSLKVLLLTPTLSKLSDKDFRKFMSVITTLDDQRLADFTAMYTDEVISARSKGCVIDLSPLMDVDGFSLINTDTISEMFDTLDLVTLHDDCVAYTTMVKTFVLMGFSEEASKRLANSMRDSGIDF